MFKHCPAELTCAGLNPNANGVVIHPTAIVSPEAKISTGTKIGAYSIIGPNIIIGKDNSIGSNVVLDGHTTIGDGNSIYQFTSLGTPPQDLKYSGEPSQVILGNNNTIREYVTIQIGTTGGGMKTVIGDQNLLMVSSHIGHDSSVGSFNVIANSVAIAGHVKIQNYVVLGGLAAVHQFCTVGEGSLIAGGAIIVQDVPQYAIAQGDRAKIVGINSIGLKRRGVIASEIMLIKSFYREVLLSAELSFNERLVNWETKNKNISQSVHEIIELIKKSSRGVISPRKGHIEDLD